MSPLANQYPSHASPPNYGEGVRTSVSGQHSGPPPGTRPFPSAFGTNTDLAGSLEGMISDNRAVAKETRNAMASFAVMSQRLMVMLDGKNGSVGGYGSGMAAGRVLLGGPAGHLVLPGGSHVYDSFGDQSVPTNDPPKVPVNQEDDSVPTSPRKRRADGTYAPNEWNTPTGSEVPENREPRNSEIEDLLQSENRKKYLRGTVGARNFRANYGIGQHPTIKGIAGAIQEHTGDWASATRTRTPTDAEMSEILKNGTPAQIKQATEVGIEDSATGLGGMIGRLAAGSSLGEAAGSLLGGAAGPVGLVVGGAMFAGHEFEAQRAQNAVYQSMEGGSNIGGLIERGRAGLFGLSQFGTMGMGQANQLFQGVTEIGLRGGQRQDALDFAVQQYRNLGMSVSDSINLISISAKTGNANLKNLANVLDTVTQSAQNASVNTEVARQNFTQMYEQGIASGLSTAGAQNLAGANQMFVNTLGVGGQGTQIVSPPMRNAAVLGMTLGQYENAVAAPGGEGVAARADTRWAHQIAGQLNDVIPGLKGLADERQHGINSPFARAVRSSGMVENETIRTYLQQLGINPAPGENPGKMWQTLQSVINGTYNPLNEVSVQQASNSMQNAVDAEKKKYASQLAFSNASGQPNLTPMPGGEQTDTAQANITEYMRRHGGNAGHAGSLLSLMENDMMGKITIGGRKMSVLDALDDPHMLARLQSGNGVTVAGPHGQESLTEWVRQHPAKSNVGNAPSAKKDGKNVGTVTVSPTPMLMQILGFSGSGGVSISQAGQIPQTGNVGPGFYPTP